jgi:hypothetical protein
MAPKVRRVFSKIIGLGILYVHIEAFGKPYLPVTCCEYVQRLVVGLPIARIERGPFIISKTDHRLLNVRRHEKENRSVRGPDNPVNLTVLDGACHIPENSVLVPGDTAIPISDPSRTVRQSKDRGNAIMEEGTGWRGNWLVCQPVENIEAFPAEQ